MITETIMRMIFQSTFPHGERRSVRILETAPCTISIHVPARGTTQQRGGQNMTTFISIHVPARGTTILINDTHEIILFQSTFPHGERLPFRQDQISQTDFNPRSRTGNDRYLGGVFVLIVRFQSTFPHGERPLHVRHSFSGSDFNPRSRTGNDMIAVCMEGAGGKFQSTFPHGERLLALSTECPSGYFNPRSRTGNDLWTWRNCSFSINFNPRSRTGNDK